MPEFKSGKEISVLRIFVSIYSTQLSFFSSLGPSVVYKPPSSCHSASLTEREEDSEEDKENRPPSPSQLAMKMKPRKLFESNDKLAPQKKGFTKNTMLSLNRWNISVWMNFKN